MKRMTRLMATGAFPAGLTATGAMAQDLKGPIPYPTPQQVSTTEPILVPYDKLSHYGTLPDYHEPEWVTELVEQENFRRSRSGCRKSR